MEEKEERLIQELVRRRIPTYLWYDFLESPKGRLLAERFQVNLPISYSFSIHHIALAATTDKYISNDFFGSISAFVEATKKNVVNPNGENANNLQTKEISNNSEGDVSVKVLETDGAKVRKKA